MYTNINIKRVSPRKPHLVFEMGYWRVSSYNRHDNKHFWDKAHDFANGLNNQIFWRN
jgi:hypothetical protein